MPGHARSTRRMGAAASRVPAAPGDTAPEIPRGLKAFLRAVPDHSCDQLMAVVARRGDYLSRTGSAMSGGYTAIHIAAKAARTDVLTAFLLHLSGVEYVSNPTNERSVRSDQGGSPRRPIAVAPSIPLSPLPPHSTDKPNALSAALNLRSVAGFTPLMAAAAAGAADCVRVLVTMGCDIRAVDCPGGRTALHVAAREGHVHIAEFLLQADRVQRPAATAAAAALRAPPPPQLVHLRTVCEALALHYAAAHGKADAVSLLLRHGSNPTAAMSEGQYDIEYSSPGITALHLAAQRGNLEVARLILFHYLASLVTRSTAPMRCPFCRSTVAGFLPATVS
ncbi:putative E3 ubiquitin-protein ligase [Tetrabaena socialis]|uniref:Putative E3 ubiquitin-protein ligase n=1 Tax=Tetrabaena socialis TaxID=47790 RepID=A0A2J8AHG1_9CHLO|nr:putative E3 ubiquitin-protein ligase [Tetrabaena socialis]|eukprot:PNH11955.1 putative E3 ubiquitin-protein ligase [Tetrabaena socialis]